MQKKKQRISIIEKMRRRLMEFFDRQDERHRTREYKRWANGWKRNATFRGKALTSSMRRRVGSRARAIELGLIRAK